MVQFKDIVTNSNYEVTTVNKEKFTVEMTCRLWAMVYIRFGRDVVTTCEAMGRMLQSTPITPFRAESLIAAGLTLIEDDYMNYDTNNYTTEAHENLLQGYFEKNLNGV